MSREAAVNYELRMATTNDADDENRPDDGDASSRSVALLSRI